MAGMYTTCVFTNFATTDSKKFERRLINWCTKACMPERSMLIFDQEDFKIENKSKIVKQDRREVYEVNMTEISFSYFHISSQMCVIYKIWENKTQSVMYNMPTKWNQTELWIGD